MEVAGPRDVVDGGPDGIAGMDDRDAKGINDGTTEGRWRRIALPIWTATHYSLNIYTICTRRLVRGLVRGSVVKKLVQMWVHGSLVDKLHT